MKLYGRYEYCVRCSRRFLSASERDAHEQVCPYRDGAREDLSDATPDDAA